MLPRIKHPTVFKINKVNFIIYTDFNITDQEAKKIAMQAAIQNTKTKAGSTIRVPWYHQREDIEIL